MQCANKSLQMYHATQKIQNFVLKGNKKQVACSDMLGTPPLVQEVDIEQQPKSFTPKPHIYEVTQQI